MAKNRETRYIRITFSTLATQYMSGERIDCSTNGNGNNGQQFNRKVN